MALNLTIQLIKINITFAFHYFFGFVVVKNGVYKIMEYLNHKRRIGLNQKLQTISLLLMSKFLCKLMNRIGKVTLLSTTCTM